MVYAIGPRAIVPLVAAPVPRTLIPVVLTPFMSGLGASFTGFTVLIFFIGSPKLLLLLLYLLPL